MEELSIDIELLSETIFGSGQSIPGFLDLEIVHDENGLPYFKGKTFKGKLREKVEEIAGALEGLTEGLNLKKITTEIFGEEGKNLLNTIKFSDCVLNSKVEQALLYGIDKNMFTKDEIKDALTDIRSFTSIGEKGIAKDGSLRQARVINKGLHFVSHIYVEKELSSLEKGLLAAGISALKHIGSMESRGKGHVNLRLMQGEKDITNEYLVLFEEEVRKYA